MTKLVAGYKRKRNSIVLDIVRGYHMIERSL